MRNHIWKRKTMVWNTRTSSLPDVTECLDGSALVLHLYAPLKPEGKEIKSRATETQRQRDLEAQKEAL